jgi:hypothetical protein
MIISVDDHVVEPPHVWQTWLPEKYQVPARGGRPNQGPARTWRETEIVHLPSADSFEQAALASAVM